MRSEVQATATLVRGTISPMTGRQAIRATVAGLSGLLASAAAAGPVLAHGPVPAEPPTAARVLDFGCGSGILAIAACLLGCTQAVAIDIDPQALTATQANAQRNGITPEQLTITEPGALDVGGYDVILANILANPLIALAPRIAALTAPGGRLCLSGILESQCAAVRDAYAPWFDFAPPAVRESWARLTGCKTR